MTDWITPRELWLTPVILAWISGYWMGLARRKWSRYPPVLSDAARRVLAGRR